MSRMFIYAAVSYVNKTLMYNLLLYNALNQFTHIVHCIVKNTL